MRHFMDITRMFSGPYYLMKYQQHVSKMATCVSKTPRIVFFQNHNNHYYHSWGKWHWGIGDQVIYITRTLQAKVWLNYASMIMDLRLQRTDTVQIMGLRRTGAQTIARTPTHGSFEHVLFHL